MKLYKKEYEDLYTSKSLLKKCKLRNVTTDNGMSTAEYLRLYRKTMKSFEMNLFDNLVKVVWLGKRFSYFGYTRKYRDSGIFMNLAYGIFIRSHVGYEAGIMRGVRNYLVTYFEDFFPEFNEENPFEKKFKYPYKRINLECLILVYQIPERLELLAHGEKKKMNYIKFVDFVVNYINCHNDDVGVDEYILTHTFYHRIPFVKVDGYINKNKEL